MPQGSTYTTIDGTFKGKNFEGKIYAGEKLVFDGTISNVRNFRKIWYYAGASWAGHVHPVSGPSFKIDGDGVEDVPFKSGTFSGVVEARRNYYPIDSKGNMNRFPSYDATLKGRVKDILHRFHRNDANHRVSGECTVKQNGCIVFRSFCTVDGEEKMPNGIGFIEKKDHGDTHSCNPFHS